LILASGALAVKAPDRRFLEAVGAAFFLGATLSIDGRAASNARSRDPNLSASA
jgi:hypothetical protein